MFCRGTAWINLYKAKTLIQPFKSKMILNPKVKPSWSKGSCSSNDLYVG